MVATPEGAAAEERDDLRSTREWLETLTSSRRLDRSELLRHYGQYRFEMGWRVSVEFTDRIREMDVLLPHTFPSDISRIALVSRPNFGTWPHIEEDGLLCLPDRTPVAAGDPVVDVKAALGAAVALVEDSIAGRNQDDLRNEFVSYWAPGATGNRRVVSLLRPKGPSRRIFVWRGTTFDLIADSDAELRQWLGFNGGTSDPHRWTVHASVLIWLRQPPLPDLYARTAADLLDLAEAAGVRTELVDLSTDVDQDGILAVIGATTENGAVFGSIGLRSPKNVVNQKGFRRLPSDVHVARYFAPAVAIERFVVDRADPQWVHGRGGDPRLPQLRQSSVVVIGAGSVGAPLALALAQAGVGHIESIDPDSLSWGNLGRHPLGADCVGRNKAESVVERLRRSLTHIRAARGHGRRWEDVARNTPQVLESADVIVSALGDWSAESTLNRWHLSRGRNMPVVYTWTEPHACAGHAVVVTASGGCFRCGFRDDATPVLRVTDWPNGKTHRQEPGCGSLFQPYGPVELMHTVAIATETVLDALDGTLHDSKHRVWAASREFVERAGGRWTQEWARRSRDIGGVVEVFDWTQSVSCPECGQQLA